MAQNDILRGIPINSKGFGTIPKLVMQDQNLGITAKALYAYFSSYSGAGDVCFPTIKKICSDLKISRDTFNKYLKQLIDSGYLFKEQVRKQGKFSHNVYSFCREISPRQKSTVAEISGDGIFGADNVGADGLDANINNIKKNIFKINNPTNKQAEYEILEYFIKQNIDYDHLVVSDPHSQKDIDEILNILVDVIGFNTKTLTINGNLYPAEIIRSQFMKIRYENIEYVLDAIKHCSTKITNVRAYLISVLFNSLQTTNNSLSAQVSYDRFNVQ